MSDNPATLTAAQAATELQVLPITVQRWLAAGRLPGVKIGGVWRIPRGEFEKMLRGGWNPGNENGGEEA
ncbi:MAG: helix-turn-helix domain-containing protein [Planctomycetota bacterium]|nr:helix-turn-helix domain-containing protein [Planctomycetota bacterium]